MSRAEITRVVTAGSFSLDGGVWDVKNNVWVVGDDYECVVIDAAHWAEPIVAAVGGRTVRAVLLTHAHDDHINAAPELCAATDAPSYLHPADRVLWDQVHESTPDGELADGNEFEVAGITLRTLHTPGHSPGACSFTARSWVSSSPATPSSRAGRGRRGARTVTSRPSSTRSGTSCSPCRRKQLSTPDTVTTRRSVPSSPTSRRGSPAVTDQHGKNRGPVPSARDWTSVLASGGDAADGFSTR